MVLFGFIWNLFEWGFKLESAFKFESNLKKGLVGNRKGEGGLFLGREPKLPKSVGPPPSIFLRTPRHPRSFLISAHRGPASAGPPPTYRGRPGH
jgi:hypothetical protein